MTSDRPTTASDLSSRDLSIVRTVARFKQLTSTQIQTLLFNTTSRTPTDRSLKRLIGQSLFGNLGFLSRIERRMHGGSNGGSGQYVYQLGQRGFYLCGGTGRYIPARAVNFHTLSVADTYIALNKLQQAGVFEIAGMSTEPDCWTTIDNITLKPDLYVELLMPNAERLKLWLEVDMGTEAQRQLKGKLEAYWRAYNGADVAVWPVFPRILWVAVDAERAKELLWVIGQGGAEAQKLFQVTTLEKLPSLFQR